MSPTKTRGGADGDKDGGGSPERKAAAHIISPYYREEKPETLGFDSIFESGNLAIAQKVSEGEYNLVLQNDVNTSGHTQWFYFKVKANYTRPTTVRFHIVNLYKGKSLYEEGLRVLVLDCTGIDYDKAVWGAPDEDLPVWKRGGADITYKQNEYYGSSYHRLYSLSFSYEFAAGEQELYFAHSIPYTYSLLNYYLNNSGKKRMQLCHSLAGNKCEYLHITNNQSKIEDKKIVFITS